MRDHQLRRRSLINHELFMVLKSLHLKNGCGSLHHPGSSAVLLGTLKIDKSFFDVLKLTKDSLATIPCSLDQDSVSRRCSTHSFYWSFECKHKHLHVCHFNAERFHVILLKAPLPQPFLDPLSLILECAK